jgi:hypothetical protein
MRRHVPGRWGLALAALLFGLALLPALATDGPKAADESDALFRSGEVLRLAIELGPKELAALRREPSAAKSACTSRGRPAASAASTTSRR